jgi:hypothetical protein
MKGLSGRTASTFFALLLASFCLLAAALSSCAETPKEAVAFVASATAEAESTAGARKVAAADSSPASITHKTQRQFHPANMQQVSRILAEQRQNLPDKMVPYASFLEDSTSLPSRYVWGSWSLGNTLISLICILEALIAIGLFSLRNKVGTAGLLTGSFMLKALALSVALIALIATSITSDFTKAAIAFDRMSVPITLLFISQQVILFAARERRSILPTRETAPAEGTEKHFRAKRRYGD